MAKNTENSAPLAAVPTPAETAMAPIDYSGWIGQVDKSAFEGIVIERVHSLQPGQVVNGELLGRGQTIETIDDKTGEVHEINTHRVQVTPQLTVALLETYGLRALRALPIGTPIRLIHNGFVRKGAKQIADVIVATRGAAPKDAQPDPRWTV